MKKGFQMNCKKTEQQEEAEINRLMVNIPRHSRDSFIPNFRIGDNVSGVDNSYDKKTPFTAVVIEDSYINCDSIELVRLDLWRSSPVLACRLTKLSDKL